MYSIYYDFNLRAYVIFNEVRNEIYGTYAMYNVARNILFSLRVEAFKPL